MPSLKSVKTSSLGDAVGREWTLEEWNWVAPLQVADLYSWKGLWYLSLFPFSRLSNLWYEQHLSTTDSHHELLLLYQKHKAQQAFDHALEYPNRAKINLAHIVDIVLFVLLFVLMVDFLFVCKITTIANLSFIEFF